MTSEQGHDGVIEGVAHLDLERGQRRGIAEAIYGEGKSVAQLSAIARALRTARPAHTGAPEPSTVTLFTRMSADRAEAVLAELPHARHVPEAGLVIWPGEAPPATGGLVVVVSAGTSDLPVATEAAATARHLGRPVESIVDCGVAGLHRLLGHVDTLRRARALIVVAGMDGALPGVVAGLVAAPVVAVPTSVGYGAAFEGLAPLLTMLNACAPGVAVVNIDNGYGAGHFAAQIAAPQAD